MDTLYVTQNDIIISKFSYLNMFTLIGQQNASLGDHACEVLTQKQ